jgi:hypothetical protein
MDDIDISRDTLERAVEFGRFPYRAKAYILALRAALDRAEAEIIQWRKDERETGEAYMRLRNIIGREAFRTPPGVSHFEVTESALKDALAARNVTTTITFDKTDIAEMLTRAEADKAAAVDAERERCAVICEQQAQVFGSDEYATGQPMSSFKERFACESNAAAIRTGGQAIEKNHCTL